MALKISHSNKKNTNFQVQVKTSKTGSEAINVRIGPQQFFYTEINFITSSMRAMISRQLLNAEEAEKPDGLLFNKVYKIGEEEAKTTPPTEEIEETETSIKSILGKASQKVEEYTHSELKVGKWEDDELKYLKRYYPTKGAKFVAEKLNRSEKSVSKKAEVQKIKRKRK